MNPDTAAAELQQELREMFAIDTQQHLDTYFCLIQQLNPYSWTGDIQHLYRAVHTIKGGAMTVAADHLLEVASGLEDLLSDLRYLEVAPSLDDGQLATILLEAGELLSSSVEASQTEQCLINLPQEQMSQQVQSSVSRLAELRDRVQQSYLGDWSEIKQIHQEFAQQGFDLVILELEIGLSTLADRGPVSATVIETAKATISQLAEIGVEIELAADWNRLLEGCQYLIDKPDCQFWQTAWLEYFQLLKACAKNSGEIDPADVQLFDQLTTFVRSIDFDPERSAQPLSLALAKPLVREASRREEKPLPQQKPPLCEIESTTDLSDSLDAFFADEDIFSSGTSDAFSDSFDRDRTQLEISGHSLVDRVEQITTVPVASATSESLADLSNLLDDFFSDLPIETVENYLGISTDPSPAIEPIVPTKRNIQIPVPLERLDRSAQQVVETLLTTRTVMSQANNLKIQLDQLTILARESSQFVTKLRQLQDDYILLRNFSGEQKRSGNNIPMERYRQGYLTINRLLENTLRLAELGQEIETSTYQNTINLDALDRSIVKLKDGIEASRLVPFRNLALRSKAVLRDLTNRYQKAAELIIKNEHIELDAGIIQQLEPVLLHLLRNAYDHGLESTQVRLNLGKKAQGKIIISLQQQSNRYCLTIEDDGGGIDANLIHHIAKSKGFAINQTRTNAELLAVLAQPGFSSNTSISDVSGRGVGMDVVISQIASIGGKLSLETNLGYGTKFSIDIPAPQLLIPCILFQVGERTIAIPTDQVLETVLSNTMILKSIDSSSPKNIGICTWKITTPNAEIPGFDLHNYWQLGNFTPAKSVQRFFPDTAVFIRTRQAENTPEIWSIADGLLGQAKLLINPLPSPLIAPAGLLGVSLQPDGKLISVLDPISLSVLITTTHPQFTHQDRGSIPDTTPPSASTNPPTILIVDDAAMIRRRLESTLNTYGFITHTCNDGLEALNWLQSNPHPALMITDIEMPHMDGFTLIDRARQAHINIPILVISSRLAEEWSKESRRLGANDYLNKGFSTSELLQKVEMLLNEGKQVSQNNLRLENGIQ